MTFIVQCPYEGCRKYMLLEDSDRGATVDCLVCKKPIKLDPSVADGQNAGPAPAPSSSGGERPSERFMVRRCPKCQTPLRIPKANEKKKIQCSRCNHVF